MAALVLLLAFGSVPSAHAGQSVPPADPVPIDPPPADLVVVVPWAGIPQPTGRDEEGLWQEADEAERRMAHSARRVRDPGLEAHVRKIMCETVGEDRCAQVRIYLMRIPVFNATMRPNGAMEIWTGALFRMASDDELAVVLAHEFAHFEQRHSLKNFRNARSNSDIMMWTALAGVPLIPELALSGIFAFSREQEREADLLSLAYLQSSNQRPSAASALWNRLIAEARATSVGRGHKPDRLLQSGMFATHPAMEARARYLKEREGPAAGAPPRTNGFRAALTNAWPDMLQDQLGRNDFAGTALVLEQLMAIAPHPDLTLAMAELHRRRGHPRDLDAAMPLYRQVIAADPARPDARRGLGLALMRAGDRPAAACALKAYRALRPDAPDAAMYDRLIEEAGECVP